MSRWILVGVSGGVIHSGTRQECEMIHEAIVKCGMSRHKFEILPIEAPALSEEVRDKIIMQLVDRSAHGPELEEYIGILEAIKDDVDTRPDNASFVAALRSKPEVKVDPEKLPEALRHLVDK